MLARLETPYQPSAATPDNTTFCSIFGYTYKNGNVHSTWVFFLQPYLFIRVKKSSAILSTGTLTPTKSQPKCSATSLAPRLSLVCLPLTYMLYPVTFLPSLCAASAHVILSVP